jgi:RecA/RadA recombinase
VATNKQKRQARKVAEKLVAAKTTTTSKKKEVPPNRSDRAAAVMDWVNEKMKGRAELVAASDYTLPYLTKRIPTGLLSIDLELMGGFPAGGLSQVDGKASSGKNYLIWCMIRQLQHFLGEKMRVLFAMTEMRVDRSQGKAAGVHVAYNDEDIASMSQARVEQGLPELTAEEIASLKHQVGHIDELHGLDAESLYDAIIKAVEQDAYHMIVIDSFGNIMSGAEAEAESLQDQTRGGASRRQYTQFCRKLAALPDDEGRVGTQPRDLCHGPESGPRRHEEPGPCS